MDLSIVIVNWNTREMLRDCLDSVFKNLGNLEAEVFVVDNGSEDGSPQMVSRDFSQVHLIRNVANCGFAAANNQALVLARGEHVLLLNSDTLVRSDVLERSQEYMAANPQVGVMGCRVLNTDGSLQITGSRWPSLLNLALLTSGLCKVSGLAFFDRYQMTRWDRTDARPVDVVSGCYMLVRRTAMAEVGLLDETFFFFGEETDWCRRFADAGWALHFAPVGEITHHGGGSVRRLNHRRDVMLTEATVRLHRKHGGRIAAALCWTLLAGFNLSRAVYWTAAAVRSDSARDRARHFRSVFAASPATWPKDTA
ncbi:MAG: glycosyltransferase family 2 protein [Pseudomonadota bacterium]